MQHLEARLLVVGRQGAQQLGILVGLGLDATGLAGSQAVVDQEQLDPAATRQADDLRRHILLVDQHQVIRPLRPAQDRLGTGQRQVGAALAVFHAQGHAQLVRGGLHEAGITGPERLGGQPRVEENHRSRLRACRQRQGKTQAMAQRLEHGLKSLRSKQRIINAVPLQAHKWQSVSHSPFGSFHMQKHHFSA